MDAFESRGARLFIYLYTWRSTFFEQHTGLVNEENEFMISFLKLRVENKNVMGYVVKSQLSTYTKSMYGKSHLQRTKREKNMLENKVWHRLFTDGLSYSNRRIYCFAKNKL